MSARSGLGQGLLEQADHLSRREPRRPKQVSLRRAVSSAYYALFHLLTEQATTALLRGRLSLFRPLLARAFNHGEMKRASLPFASGTLYGVAVRAVGSQIAIIEKDLADLASAFLTLQEARNEADYDTARRFTRREAQMFLGQARDAFAAWSRVADRDSARLYLISLLVMDRVKGR